MQKRVTSAFSVLCLTVLLSVAFAGAPDTTTIQNGSTITEVRNGQTLEMTSNNVSVEVTFDDVSEDGVHGRVLKVSGTSGTFTIRWVEGNVSTTIHLAPNNPEQMFGLEGGDGDKRNSNGRVN